LAQQKHITLIERGRPITVHHWGGTRSAAPEGGKNEMLRHPLYAQEIESHEKLLKKSDRTPVNPQWERKPVAAGK